MGHMLNEMSESWIQINFICQQKLLVSNELFN